MTPRALRHVRPVVPLHFPSSEPEDERTGESTRHARLCEALYQALVNALGPGSTVASDAFVYWDASAPRRVLAPDAFVKVGVPQHHFESYKTWREQGAPEVAFEILSPSDSPERWSFEEKLERYRSLGVHELVVFHVEGRPGSRLRVWDRLDGDLVERVVEGERTPCVTLGLTLTLAPLGAGWELPAGLRLARDEAGSDLVLTDPERLARADEARVRAEARLAELETELAARTTPPR